MINDKIVFGSENMETIYDRITLLLKKKNKTRKDLCAATGISYHTLMSLYQRKSENMKLDTVMLIADYLGVTADYLISGTDIGLAVSETGVIPYGDEVSPNMELEVVRIMKRLRPRDKAILLSKAYELEEKEKKEEQEKE